MKTTTVFVACSLFASASVSAQSINDAQIASIVVTANQVDIDAGKLAASRATSADVKKFAQLMVTDHTGVNNQAVALATKLKVTPQDNATSQALKAGGDKNLAKLRALSGDAFDKAYVDNEVAYHQQVLDALDKTLIPSASNAELKALLVKVRPAFVAHLEHARHVQASLGKRVTIDGTRFQPDGVTVKVGEAIVWVNNDPFPHTATSSAGRFDSKTIQPGKSWTFKALTRGDFAYTCAFHPSMTGIVSVR